MPVHQIVGVVYDQLTRPLESAVLAPRRAELLAALTGEVLDVGAGTGANLRHFRQATRVVAAEPARSMRQRIAGRLGEAPVTVEIDDARAEALPYADGSFDAVVFTCVLCSVDDPVRAVAEARRVLKPNGRLVVLEHVRGTGRLAVWQDRLTPLWSRLVAGCHPNRDIAATVSAAGFRFERLESFDPFPRWVPTRPLLAATAAPSNRHCPGSSPDRRRP